MSPHPIVHIEISAKDLKAADQFYSDLFGWHIEQNPEFNYATFDPGEGPGGGFNLLSESNPAGTVVVYVGTDDIEASLAKAEALGARVLVTKTEIPGTGWFGMFSDPTGNPVGLYTAMEGVGQ